MSVCSSSSMCDRTDFNLPFSSFRVVSSYGGGGGGGVERLNGRRTGREGKVERLDEWGEEERGGGEGGRWRG